MRRRSSHRVSARVRSPPGAAPARRDFVVAPGSPPGPLDRTLRALLAPASWSEVRELVRTGKILVDGAVVLDPVHRVTGGSTVGVRPAAPRPRPGPSLAASVVVHRDAQVVVVRKPAGLSTVAWEDEPDALDRAVRRLLERDGARRGAPLVVVHRLDKETSGLLVLARTRRAAQHLRSQFRSRRVHRRYLAIAWGDVPAATHRSRLVADRGDGRRGSTGDERLGREAVTHVRPLEPLRGATLVECRLETGRTHQIRIHLAEAGHPVLGDRVYGERRRDARADAPRVMLHAAELGFEHPTTGEPLAFVEPLPEDFSRVLEERRRGSPSRS